MPTLPPDEPIRVMRIIARLNVGGPAIHVSLLTRGLNDEQFESKLVTGVIGDDEGDMSYLLADSGDAPIILPSLHREISPLADLKTLRDLIRLIREFRPHVVHTHTAKAGFVGRWAAYLCGVPVIVHTFHGHVFHSYFGRFKTAIFRFFETLTADLSDVIVTLSEGLKQELVDYGIASPDRFRVIPLGLDLEPFTNSIQWQGQFRAQLGGSTENPLVGIIGRLVPVKNHALFLSAARHILNNYPHVRFVVVGDGERRAELEEQMSELGIASQVHFVGWQQNLPRIYADLDAIVISSNNEGTPVSLIEAMAAGVPVISTAVGGVPDLLHEGDFGSLVPAGDAQALGEEIIRVLDVGRTQTQARAREYVLQYYDAQRLIADVRALYLEILARKGFDVTV